MEIKVLKNLLEANENEAGKIRAALGEHSVIMYNLISSPGSGKTSLLQKTLAHFREKKRTAVIEGDVTTDKDAQRLKEYGAPIILINTDGGCHLNSNSIKRSLHELDLPALDYLFIENVGNLVCPSEFDLGEHAKVALLSVTEGDDKPAKYPMLFREAGIVILNKIDLLPYVTFDKTRFYEELGQINPDVRVLEVSCTQDIGLDKWFDWIGREQ